MVSLAEELDQLLGVVTPERLTGHDRAAWQDLIAGLRAGKWRGVPVSQIFEVMKRRTGLSCGLSAFRLAVNRALKEPRNDEEPKAKRRSRR